MGKSHQKRLCAIGDRKTGESKALLVLSSGTKVELNSQIGDTIRKKGFILNERDYIDYSRQDNDSQVKEVVYNELIVPAGGEYRLVLSDGSVVYMNSESRLKYPVKFIEDKRVVKLEGEAYFDVTHDEQHPFIVRTEQLNVKVLGTGFNVMAYKGDARTEVTLVHGKVDVKSKNISEILTPSRQFVMNNDTREYEVRSVNVNTYVDWKNGILNFDAMPLEELGEKVSRWYGVKFFFSKESLKYLKFSGAFKKYNNIDYILDLIEATTDVSFKLKGDVVIVNEK
ncbi:MAG: FecR domain-containing protein [Butyricimonas faecihominis]